MLPTADERFKYNLLAERINDAIWSARANSWLSSQVSQVVAPAPRLVDAERYDETFGRD
jgi:hypothetical protein